MTPEREADIRAMLKRGDEPGWDVAHELLEELVSRRDAVKAFQAAVLDLSSRSLWPERDAALVRHKDADEVTAFTLQLVGEAGTRCGLWSAADFMTPYR